MLPLVVTVAVPVLVVLAREYVNAHKNTGAYEAVDAVVHAVEVAFNDPVVRERFLSKKDLAFAWASSALKARGIHVSPEEIEGLIEMAVSMANRTGAFDLIGDKKPTNQPRGY